MRNYLALMNQNFRTKILVGLFFAVITVPFSVAFSADLPITNYEYQQDFETTDPFQYWVSDGTYTVNSKELSKTRASSGTKSFKLDVTFNTATYLYWKIPLQVPCVGQLQFSGDLYVENTDGPSVTLVTNVSFSPAPFSGSHKIETIAAPTSSWVKQSSDWVGDADRIFDYMKSSNYATMTTSDVGFWADKIGLYISAPKGGRIILYVDNVTLRGMVPEEIAYKSNVSSVWQDYLTRVQTAVYTMADFVLNFSGESSGPQAEGFISSAKSQAEGIKTTVQQIGYPTPDSYSLLVSLYNGMKELVEYHSTDQMLLTFPIAPIKSVGNSVRILPSTLPGFAPKGDSLSIRACRGTYEPASFVIRAERSVSDIQLTATDLLGSGGRKIQSSEVDIKLVKCWYQSDDDTILKTDQRILLPELLLNDDKLVKVDYVQQRNFLRVTIDGIEQYLGNSLPSESIPDTAIIKDADTLQPFDLDAESNKQIWITVHIPDSMPAGDYKGNIEIQAKGVSPLSMNLTCTVLPFDLQHSPIEHAIYYRGQLPATTKKGINSANKTQEQYLAELNDMKKHGIQYPTFYQHKYKQMEEMFGIALTLRNQVGFPKDRLYSRGISTGNPTSTQDLTALGDEVTAWLNAIKGYGFSNLYVYGIDEAKGDELISQRAAWQRVLDSGAKVFVAGYHLADEVGDVLDLPIINGKPNPYEVEKFHARGKKVFAYNNPQVGIENPEIYRRNYGLEFIFSNYDGVMDYAYQHEFGHIWNDFDGDVYPYRDHVFAYPTSNGVIDTIQWEGYRAAVDDVKYLATLIVAKKGQKEQVLNWLKPLLIDQANMCEVRSKIVDEIIKLNGVTIKAPTLKISDPVE